MDERNHRGVYQSHSHVITPGSAVVRLLASLIFVTLWLALGLVARAAEAAAPNEDPNDAPEDVTKMAVYNVSADRLEDFGFRVALRGPPWSIMAFVTTVLPNTAAAKAGLRPGDRIVTSDGRAATASVFSFSKWRQFERRKWAEVSSGKKNVAWTLEVESWPAKSRRTVEMKVPTPAPHWGAKRWQSPPDRVPAQVAEPGPLADLARRVLDHGIWMLLRWQRPAGAPKGQSKAFDEPVLGYSWTLHTPDQQSHTIIVRQQDGRTEIQLHRRAGDDTHAFTTSPTGALERSRWHRRGKPPRSLELEEERAEFANEIAFWLAEVGSVSGRWPFELLRRESSSDPMTRPVAAVRSAPPSAPRPAARSESFSKLPVAAPEQRALFADALGKLGADEDRWAYTETSRGLDDKRMTVVRVDPSRPGAERCTLLKIDGKPPSAADTRRWREEGRDSSAALGELPPIAQIVELDDVRVASVERTATVFELALRGGGPFPSEKFSARFRVNDAQRGFEDFSVKLRESLGVATGVKVTEAGLEVRFQTLDPAHPPQPVLLKAGGAVRVLLLVKFGRTFEATRSDFRRVEHYREEAEAAGAIAQPSR